MSGRRCGYTTKGRQINGKMDRRRKEGRKKGKGQGGRDVVWEFSHQLLTKKISHRLAYRMLS